MNNRKCCVILEYFYGYKKADRGGLSSLFITWNAPGVGNSRVIFSLEQQTRRQNIPRNLLQIAKSRPKLAQKGFALVPCPTDSEEKKRFGERFEKRYEKSSIVELTQLPNHQTWCATRKKFVRFDHIWSCFFEEIISISYLVSSGRTLIEHILKWSMYFQAVCIFMYMNIYSKPDSFAC